MNRNIAYRYELKPNVHQRILLAKHAGVARFAYNWGLGLRKELYENEKKCTNAIAQHKLLNKLKQTDFPWMYEVSKCAPQEALRDLDKAYNNYFLGLKQNQSVGLPKFKKKGEKDSFRLTGTIKVNSKEVQLPRLGVIRLKEKPQVEGKILSATLSKEADRWYVSILVEQEWIPPKPIEAEGVGIDVGLTCFVALSTGEKIKAPKPLSKKLNKLKRLSKQHSRKEKGSKNRKKSALKLARLHRKIRNIRHDFLHQTTTKLAKTKSVLAVEDLDVKGMMNKGLGRQISDVSWSAFYRMLEYKSEWYGSKVIKAPRFFPSSKICSECHIIVEHMPLELRRWTCPCCKKNHDRDINAAINLINYATGSSPGSYACGDPSGGGTGNWSTSYGSLKQELTNGIFVHKL
jgi:putative transposase